MYFSLDDGTAFIFYYFQLLMQFTILVFMVVNNNLQDWRDYETKNLNSTTSSIVEVPYYVFYMTN